MQLETLFIYKEKIQQLSRCDLRRLEGHATVEGATSISKIALLLNSVIEHIKDALTFIDSPFDEAVIDNLTKSGSAVMAEMNQLMQPPYDKDFDARDILSIKDLDGVVENLFRCIVAIKSRQGLSLPKAVTFIDNILRDAIEGALALLSDTREIDWPTLTGKPRVDNTKYITFTLLDKQKYFNDQERLKIAEAERTRQEAILEADRKAKEQQEFTEAVVSLEKYMSIPRGELTSKFYKFILPASRAIDALGDYPFKKEMPSLIVLNKAVRSGDLSALFNIVKWKLKMSELRFVSMDTRTDINDCNNDSIVDSGTCIDVQS